MAEEDKRRDREVVVEREREPRGSNVGLIVVVVIGVILLFALLFGGGGFFGNGGDADPAPNDTTDIEADVDVDGTAPEGGGETTE